MEFLIALPSMSVHNTAFQTEVNLHISLNRSFVFRLSLGSKAKHNALSHLKDKANLCAYVLSSVVIFFATFSSFLFR